MQALALPLRGIAQLAEGSGGLDRSSTSNIVNW
jgi:hypothetical protein